VKHPNPSLGHLVVSKVDAFSSELSFKPDVASFQVPPLFYCKLVTRGAAEFTVQCDDKAWLETVFPPDEQNIFVKLVDDADAAALRLLVANGQVHFERNDPMINPHIGFRFPHVVDQGKIPEIREIVRCAMHFTYHLTRPGADDFKGVWMELRILEAVESDDFDLTLTPVGKNLIEDEPATIVVDEAARLGMTIHNRTDVPLYPYLFYFDPSDLTISKQYLCF
jgi:hypothetical protein